MSRVNRRMKVWMIGGGAVGSAFGPVPVALAEASTLGFSTWALFALWPAFVLFGTGFGWAVAYLLDQFEGSTSLRNERRNSSFQSDARALLRSDRP